MYAFKLLLETFDYQVLAIDSTGAPSLHDVWFHFWI